MKVTMLLADAAQVSEGKLHVLGAGWRFTGPDPAASAIGMIFEVPWDQANMPVEFALQLVDTDGKSAVLPDGGELKVEGKLEVGRPPGHPQGASLSAPIAAGIAALPLAPGSYEWRLMVNGESDADWTLPFIVRGHP
jgi:hypothetical protein